jgi:hypothetical protein
MTTKTEEKIQKTAVVARGHTVTAPHPTDTHIVRSVNPDDDTVTFNRVPVQHDFGPGETVTLSEEDFQRLSANGFLVDGTVTPAAAAVAARGGV